MVEVWRDVPGIESLRASSLGRIKKKSHKGTMPNGSPRWYHPRPTYGYDCYATKGSRHIYKNVHYHSLGNIKVHRAVCLAFHGLPPFEGAVVIHKDEDATNNKPENLRWGSQKENLNSPGHIEYCSRVCVQKMRGKTINRDLHKHGQEA